MAAMRTLDHKKSLVRDADLTPKTYCLTIKQMEGLTMRQFNVLFLLASLSCCLPIYADQAADSMVVRIDELLVRTMQQHGVTPAAVSSDAEFLRRISLDLAGGIPSVSQAREFLADESPNKRAKLIERLLASPATVNHLAETWRNAMLPSNASPELLRNSAGMQNWLREQFSNNMRYDRIVSDLIAATGTEQDGPALFFTALDLEPKKIAGSTARIFLGLQIECAECHDHPFDDWKQEDFWSYAAFFARLPKNDNMARAGNFKLSDRATGEVTLPDTEQVVLPR